MIVSRPHTSFMCLSADEQGTARIRVISPKTGQRSSGWKRWLWEGSGLKDKQLYGEATSYLWVTSEFAGGELCGFGRASPAFSGIVSALAKKLGTPQSPPFPSLSLDFCKLRLTDGTSPVTRKLILSGDASADSQEHNVLSWTLWCRHTARGVLEVRFPAMPPGWGSLPEGDSEFLSGFTFGPNRGPRK